MKSRRALCLHEELLLLALKDEKGTVASGTQISHALAGAILAELMLAGRMRLGRDGKTAELVSRESLGEPLLDECLQLVARSKKPKKLTSWVSTVAGWTKLPHRVADGLCQRGVLRADSETVLLFFERRVFPEVDPKPERALIDRLRSAIFHARGEVDARTVVTLSLAHRTGILKVVFAREDLKVHKARIEQIIKGDATGQATKEVIEALQAAIFISTCVVPIIIT